MIEDLYLVMSEKINPMNVTTQFLMTPEELEGVVANAVVSAISQKEQSEANKLFDQLDYFTANQTAKLLGITVETLRKKVKEGKLRKEERDVRERYHRSEIIRYIRARHDATAPFPKGS